MNANSTEATVSNLTNGSNVVVNATLIKQEIQSKVKELTRSTTLEVTLSKYTKSGTNANTSVNDGLTHNQFYGLRVQDEEVSLNRPDVTEVVAVYESLDASSPSLDTITFTSTADVTNNAIVGENFTGTDSNAIARVVTKPSANVLGVVYLTAEKINNGVEVTFAESGIITNVQAITGSFKNITSNFGLDKGQKDHYDYSRQRTKDSTVPSRRLLIVFDLHDSNRR